MKSIHFLLFTLALSANVHADEIAGSYSGTLSASSIGIDGQWIVAGIFRRAIRSSL